MSKEEKEEYGSFEAYFKQTISQAHPDHLRSKFEKDEAPKPRNAKMIRRRRTRIYKKSLTTHQPIKR